MLSTFETYILDDVYPYLDNVVRPHRDTPAGRIEYFSDIFLEWFTFDGSHAGDVDKFLAQYGCDDVFNAQQFTDLVMGNAYLDKSGVQYVVAKLPFVVTCERAGVLNAAAAENKSAYCIKIPRGLVEQARADRTADVKRRYRASHKAKIAQYNHDYWARNRDALREKQQKHYYENHAEIRARKNATARQRYTENRDVMLAHSRAVYAANPTARRAKSAQYYYDNRAECQRRNNDAYARRVARESQAREMCPVFQYVYNLKKTQRDAYLTVFKPTEHIVDKAWRKCASLSSNDYGICPIVCGGERAGCPMSRAYALPDAVAQIQKYVADICTRQK